MITIIDYKAGNAPSVYNAIKSLNIDCKMASTSTEIEQASKIILPGVGSASETMSSLEEMDVIHLLNEMVLTKGVPFLGICVGLQVLFDHSEEGNVDCLGWIPGKVKKFSASQVRVPQMGWNSVTFQRSSALIQDVPENSYYYFVNSYYAAPENHSDVLGVTHYGLDFCSVVSHKNIHATQFHVEKSGNVGLQILKNFCLNGG
ncbi:imidazole glycerol phosphate synthase subunit HisH [Paenibacillus sp. GCM10012307]|uniref:Imidazole glycerol phosphate synthase subunit HisH n=1 Tax=Paenibacillus roseus TaxID=2798579 RepID=A0A934MPE9_9BACL|nr:imidazole glycerol phosphate synthase subunit HisH [Paenibacillus roseus]MBJ6362006.1 imidazole glycerol phosphate synthase subunit HisH [Paenibacillus roseus]